MNKQSAFINEEGHEKIVKENEEEKHKELKKELKRKRNCERQRAYYQRQKDLKKNEEKKLKKKVPKTNAERQREFRQRKAGKSYVDKKRRKLCINVENVVQGRAVENIENVTIQGNQFHTQQLHIYEQRNECITPKVILHRNTGIPGDGEKTASRDSYTQTEHQTPHEVNVKSEPSQYVCDACKQYISGVRYKCVQCSDYDVCAACEARGVHALHYALRVPEHSVQDEVLRVVEAIRKCLGEDPSTIMIPVKEEEIKIEIKEELESVDDENMSDVEECDPLSAHEEQQVPRAKQREQSEIYDDTLYVHTSQQPYIGPTQHTVPKQHTTPTQHSAPTRHTAPAQHTVPTQHTTPTQHTAPTRHTAPTQLTAPTHHARTASSYYAQVASEQYEGCSTKTRSFPSTKDPITKTLPSKSKKRRKNPDEQENRTAEASLPEQRLLVEEASQPSDETSSCLKQPLKINFDKIAMPPVDQSDTAIDEK